MLRQNHIRYSTSNTDKKILRIINGHIPSSLKRHWSSLLNEGDGDLLCQPLEKYGITYFLYVKRYGDGSQFEITNQPEWSEYYYKHEYYTIGPFKNINHLYDNGKYLWLGRGPDYERMYQIARESFNIDHGYTLVYKHSDCNEFFHFAGGVQNCDLINFYLNNDEVLERFILYFKDKFSELIKKAERKKFIISHPHNCYMESECVFCPEYVELRKQMPIEKYYVCDSHNTYLTQREVDCVKWYIIGKTAEEISLILNISKRTVESHLEKVKKKLNCYKKSQLVRKIHSLIKIL